MNGGDHRFWAAFERVLNFGERSAFRRFAELGNVCAGNKGAAGANQNDGFNGRIGRGLLDAVAKAGAHVCRKRIHRRCIDREHGDIAFTGQVGNGIDGGHRACPLRLLQLAGSCSAP